MGRNTEVMPPRQDGEDIPKPESLAVIEARIELKRDMDSAESLHGALFDAVRPADAEAIGREFTSLASKRSHFLGTEDAKRMIDLGLEALVASYLGAFMFSAEERRGVVEDLAKRLMAAGNHEAIIRNLDAFDGAVNHGDLVEALLSAGKGSEIVLNADKLPKSPVGDRKARAVFHRIIEGGLATSVATRLRDCRDAFGLDEEDVAKLSSELILAGNGKLIADNIEEFAMGDRPNALARYSELARLLIETGDAKAVARNIKSFLLLEKDVALALIEAGEGYSVATNPDRFMVIDEDMAKALDEAGLGWGADLLRESEWFKSTPTKGK